MFKFEQSVLNSEGQPIVGAQVAVYLNINGISTSTLATLYEDDQTTTKTNPLTTDATGFVSCKAANGKYDYTVSVLVNGSFQLVRRVNGVIFDDPAEGGNSGISLSMPGEYTVTGSPGNAITVSKKTQTANTFYRGPKTGVAASPTFDTIVVDDLPIASQSQAEGGSNATTVLTPQRTAQAISKQAILKPVVSGDLSFTAGQLLTFAHNFGFKPSATFLEAVCVTADQGWVAGDILDVSAGNWFSGNGSANFMPYYDAANLNTTVSVRCGSGGFVWANKSTGTGATITAASWRLRIKACP